MSWKRIDRIISACVFGYALLLYTLTVAPTASFWDAGEFIAIAHGLQVSHPPGAPVFMLVGRLFSMFVPASMVSLAINMISVLASAITILLTYWIIVRLVREWQGNPEQWDTGSRITAIVGGVIGACTFAVTDSFWFNAVEAEVYAMSMFFTATVVWLIMRWSDMAQQEASEWRGKHHPFGLEANRILILVAYLFGLAIGVHLLSLLGLFFIALIFFFVEFDRDEWTIKGKPDWRSGRRWFGILAAGIVASAAFLLIYPVIVQMLPAWAGETGWPLTALFGLVGVVIFGVWYSQKHGMQVVNLIALCVMMVLIGYSTYALIFIRSAADPPIDENDPETQEAIVSYLKREQYGQTPLLRGITFNDRTNQVGGNETYFPRRHSPSPQHWRVYARYDSDWSFFWRYQVSHMYVRYFMWNFSGRESDFQDARAITGIRFIDGQYEYLLQTPSERASRNKYFALPLLLGLLGVMFHFSKDWRRAFCVLVLFLVTGLGIILYLNQTPMQPRERDYSYVASFFAFSLWVGIGATGVLQLVREAMAGIVQKMRHGALLGLGGLLFLAVPGWMAVENYDDHDRSGRYVAPDYAYNMLMTLEEDAIVFTNGDNDTFPLWYIQEVEGVRRDVRVVNLSLLNTPWYIRQLKHQSSRDSEPLPISFSDDTVRDIGLMQWRPSTVSLPVDKEQLTASSDVYIAEDDVGRLESPMTWELRGRGGFGQDPSTGEEIRVLYGADVAALNILQTNAEQGWSRPVYFAVTVGPSGQLDLQEYFQLEGQAYRIVPIRHDEGYMGRVVPDITLERLQRFRFTNLDDPDVYFDENIRKMVDNYRNVYAHTAITLAEEGRGEDGKELLDDIMEKIPYETIPGDERSFLIMSDAYRSVGDMERAVSTLSLIEPILFHRILRVSTQREEDFLANVVQAVRNTYFQARDYEAMASFDNRLGGLLGDSTSIDPEELRRIYEAVESGDSVDAVEEDG